MAMEKLVETQKRAVKEGEQENHTKKKRSGNETISFPCEKAESEKALREEELAIQRKQKELEEKKLASYLDQQKSIRVWKGIFGIRDLTKIRCGNRENNKYIDGIQDLTVPLEAGLAKNWARDAGFMFACLSGMLETVTTHRF